MKRNFAVIGLGSFGGTIAAELARLGHDVLGIDCEERNVSQYTDLITHAVIADSRDEKALRDLAITDYDVVVVAIGEDLEANILTTLLLKTLGVKEVWAKALNHNHHKILSKLGADRIIHPEHEMGLRVAQSLNYTQVMDYISLGHDQYVVEIQVSEKLAGKTLQELRIEERLRVKLLALKRDKEVMAPPLLELPLKRNDQLLIQGSLINLRQLSPEL